MTNPYFRNISKLFVFSLKNSDNNPTSNSFAKYYMPLVEIKDFNVLIDNKPFFDESVKNKKCTKNLLKCQDDDYTTGNLLDYLYHQKYYKLIGIDLSRQPNMTVSQQISFIEKLEEDDGAAIFFIAAKQQRTDLNFSLDSLNIIE